MNKDRFRIMTNGKTYKVQFNVILFSGIINYWQDCTRLIIGSVPPEWEIGTFKTKKEASDALDELLSNKNREWKEVDI